MTVLVPASMVDDLKALRMATFQSTGDLVNRLIEAELEARAEAVREGRELLASEGERKARAMARELGTAVPEAVAPPGSSPEASEDSDPRAMLTLEDVALWASEGADKEAPRRLADGSEFVKWLRVEGRAGTLKDADDFAQIYRSLHAGQSEGTISKHEGRFRSLARWWAKR